MKISDITCFRAKGGLYKTNPGTFAKNKSWGTALKQSSHNKHFLKLLIKYKSVGWTINSIRIIYNDRIISPSQEHCTKMEDISH